MRKSLIGLLALVVAGDKHGRVGVGLGKAGEVADAIRKGGEVAKTQMSNIALREQTIPHEIETHFSAAGTSGRRSRSPRTAG